MKSVCFLFFIFFASSSIVSAQNDGRIVYRISTERLSIDDNESQAKQKVYKLLNSLSRIRDSLYFHLDYSNSESLFYLNKNKNIGMSNEKGYNSVVRSFNTVYYVNNETGNIIEQTISDGNYLVTSSTDEMNWDTTKEKKIIDGYLCFKAITNIKAQSLTKGEYLKKIEAWYCPSLPLNIGPKMYGNLPGLIMELIDGKLTYYVDSMDLNPKFKIQIDKPNNGKKISKKDYLSRQPKITKDNFEEYIGN